MRRTLIISGLLLVLMAFTSCGQTKSSIDLNTTLTSANVEQEKSSGDLQSSGEDSSDIGAGVIAKSGNAVSSSDKEEVIKQLDKELDSLFKSINDSKDIGN